MVDASAVIAPDQARRPERMALLRSLARDPVALVAAIFLTIVLLSAIFGPLLFGQAATTVNLLQRNAPPTFDQGVLMIMGADTLGRPVLARILVGARNTMTIAAAAILMASILGAILGLIAGYFGRWLDVVIMRFTDVVMSFPSLLLALVILYIVGPSVTALISVLAISRIPVYARTARAEVLELKHRMFVQAAIAMGATSRRIVVRHILPLIFPTVLTVAAIDCATVILSESALSFLGLGIQPPEFTWGAMVASGRNFLGSAWWLAFWPGLAITLTTISLNLLASWARTMSDARLRWKLEAQNTE